METYSNAEIVANISCGRGVSFPGFPSVFAPTDSPEREKSSSYQTLRKNIKPSAL